MRYGLYFGCAIPTRLPSVERATPYVLERLGLESAPLEDMACCMDPIVLKSMSVDVWIAVAARNLAVAAQQGVDAVLTLCNGCFCSLNEAARLLDEDPALLQRVNDYLDKVGRSYDGGMKVVHLAQVLDALPEDQITAAVVNGLEGRKIATFHGCHLVRPSRYAQVDDAVRPQLLDRLVARLGGEAVAYADHNPCCGMGFVPSGEKVGAESLAPVLEAVVASGASWIVTPCPSCFLQLETAQRLAKVARPLPVLHVAELFALALGLGGEEIGLKFHRVPFPKTAVRTGGSTGG
ncbi:MAG: CoB--CoM heterodisulfide reductase iron-sulfur subunit B family protein [Planctomycetota bacterium]|jgi:heterodisulfide reductase subunit B